LAVCLPGPSSLFQHHLNCNVKPGTGSEIDAYISGRVESGAPIARNNVTITHHAPQHNCSGGGGGGTHRPQTTSVGTRSGNRFTDVVQMAVQDRVQDSVRPVTSDFEGSRHRPNMARSGTHQGTRVNSGIPRSIIASGMKSSVDSRGGVGVGGVEAEMPSKLIEDMMTQRWDYCQGSLSQILTLIPRYSTRHDLDLDVGLEFRCHETADGSSNHRRIEPSEGYLHD